MDPDGAAAVVNEVVGSKGKPAKVTEESDSSEESGPEKKAKTRAKKGIMKRPMAKGRASASTGALPTPSF